MLNSLYLRLSITDRCNLRCQYCRPTGGDACSSGGLLSSAEILRLVGEADAAIPIRKVRITGGEPLIRRDMLEIVRGLRALLPRAELGMTTNGTLLSAAAPRRTPRRQARSRRRLVVRADGCHRRLNATAEDERTRLTPEKWWR